jgi:fructose-bisphosphate aldolase, class I
MTSEKTEFSMAHRKFQKNAPSSLSYVGKQLRFERIFRDDSRSVIFAMDHGFERGPSVFSDSALNPADIISKVVDAGVDAAMVTKGVAKVTSSIWRNKIGLILKISGKTELRPKKDQAIQSQIGSVEEAVKIGADAVATTVYWGSEFENEMLARLNETVEKSDSFGLPVLQLAYPRVEGKTNYEPEIVSYAVRLAFETGADAIKTYYTGSSESFSKVVASAGGVPVLLSGGAASEHPIKFLQDVQSVMQAGAKGVVVGRNVFQSKDPGAMVNAVKRIVHDEWPSEKAESLLN